MIMKVKTLLDQMVDLVQADVGMTAVYIGDDSCGEIVTVDRYDFATKGSDDWDGMLHRGIQAAMEEYKEDTDCEVTKVVVLSEEALIRIANKVLSPEAIGYSLVKSLV